MQRNCLRIGLTAGNGMVAVYRRDTLMKLVRLGLVTADSDGKGGRLTTQGTSVAAIILHNPDRTTFEIMTPTEYAKWEAKQEDDEEPQVPSKPTTSLAFLGSATPKRHTGAERYSGGKNLPDDSDISQASTADLVVSLCTTLDNMTRTTHMTSLAVLGDYAGKLWWEMIGRGVEFA
ncbi:hypothetical protein [Streptomyces sp. ME19-01-6]|uniref:hypothetical protein n=1 Tax=Streptomyces sp. ME19-01-6 TaxID=3028686 RepID=UPI0029A1D49B|nr:hypothetical protein [Streptomyces sp. ME19-01-6]MDX3232967.1 hypothetical protein [Streptomyces sp. ME19-01-6]